jgi:hydroxymethylpyrimidine/phosphomethylpyrimidine kinase
VPEAEALSGIGIRDLDGMRRAAERIQKPGGAAVLVKGGHLPETATDVLLIGSKWYTFPATRIDTQHTHGTGCTYSAAITAGLALGLSVEEAVARAKKFITGAIRTAPALGGGCGPVNHFAPAR